MSIEALNWVLNEAPNLTTDLIPLMIGLANHAGADGRGSYPSQARLAWYARCSERTVRRYLVRAQEAGLIRPGDQRFVLHLPADKRPVVWDLQMGLKRADERPAPGRPGRPRKVEPEEENRGDTGDRPKNFAGQGTDENRGDTGVRADTGDQIGGTPEVNRVDTGVLQTVLEPSVEPPPPTPQADGDSSNGGKAAGAADNPEFEEQMTNCVDEVAASRPEWSKRRVVAAVRDALEDGRDPQIVLAAMRLVATDPQTRVPGRLNEEGDWWARAARIRHRADAVSAPAVKLVWCDRHSLKAPEGSECRLCTEEASNGVPGRSDGSGGAFEIDPKGLALLPPQARARVAEAVKS